MYVYNIYNISKLIRIWYVHFSAEDLKSEALPWHIKSINLTFFASIFLKKKQRNARPIRCT